MSSNQVVFFERVTTIPAPRPDVFNFFSAPANLARITPPSLGFTIVKAPDRPLRGEDLIEYRIRVAGVPLKWITRISSWEEGIAFSDEQLRGPYKQWLHTHSFASVDEHTTLMRDFVVYELPFGKLGRIAGSFFVRRQLRSIFDFREKVIRKIFRELTG